MSGEGLVLVAGSAAGSPAARNAPSWGAEDPGAPAPPVPERSQVFACDGVGRACVHAHLLPCAERASAPTPTTLARRYAFDAEVNDARIITVPRLDGFKVDMEGVR